jgi:hypothetical protein
MCGHQASLVIVFGLTLFQSREGVLHSRAVAGASEAREFVGDDAIMMVSGVEL